MPLFQYKAASSDGGVVEGTLESASREQAIEQVHKLGHIPIRVETAQQGSPRPRSSSLFTRKRITHDQLLVATSELATLLKAGLPLDQALNILITLAESEKLAEVLGSVHEKIKGGASLADSLKQQDEVFNNFYINLVRAGEMGGALDMVLERLSEHLERAKEIRDSIISALIYPAILVFVALLSIFVLLAYVVPQFSELFAGVGQVLPLPTRITIAVGEYLQNFGWTLPLVLLLLSWFMKRQLSHPVSARRWHSWFLRLPMIGNIILNVEVARFTRTLSILLKNGVHLLQAISIAKDTIGNRVMAEGIERVAGSLKEGQRFAEPLAEDAQFPPFAVHMIRVGEESGRLEEMLLQVATRYDRETENTIKRSLALLEPILILVLGLVIAGVVMSILVAILGINKLVI